MTNKQEKTRGRKVVKWMYGVAVMTGLAWLSSCAHEGHFSDTHSFGSPITARTPLKPGSAMPAKPKSPEKADVKPAEERPGLATGFGKQINDEWEKKSFVRDGSKPKGTGVIYYNDREGVNAMTGYKYRVGALQKSAGEMVEWGIKGRVGYLSSYRSRSRRFAVGSAGSPYSIVVKNRCRSQVEVVLSVDGLDVIDGKPASFSKRGYVIGAGETLEVKGWRTGWDSVARFEFSSVGESFANRRHGNARNVGVIGLAVFGEKGVDPWKWMPNEVNNRRTASPFAEAP